MGDYRQAYERSLNDPEGFWRDAATAIDWDRAPDRILDARAAPIYRWFPDARLNTCHNALDRHVAAGRGEQAALIHDSPVTDQLRTYTYRELRDEVALFAGALRRLGVGPGDRVVLYLAMVPEAAGTTCPACGCCSWPGNGSTRGPTRGRGSGWAYR